MTWEEMWQRVRHGYWRVNSFLEAFYRHGAVAHGVQGVVREFLDGPPEGVQLAWAHDRQGPICHARDARGTYRIELHRRTAAGGTARVRVWDFRNFGGSVATSVRLARRSCLETATC